MSPHLAIYARTVGLIATLLLTFGLVLPALISAASTEMVVAGFAAIALLPPFMVWQVAGIQRAIARLHYKTQKEEE